MSVLTGKIRPSDLDRDVEPTSVLDSIGTYRIGSRRFLTHDADSDALSNRATGFQTVEAV